MGRQFRGLSVALCLMALPQGAQADSLSAGNTAYAKGDVNKAIKKWQQSSKPEAAFRIAALAEEGKLPNCDAVVCAAAFYFKAGNAGHVPSITHLAILNFNNGFKDIGLNQFRLAARYNDVLARKLLGQMAEAIPEPDLYYQAIELERQRQLAVQAAVAQSQAQAAQMLGYLIGCGFGSACGSPANSATYTPAAAQTVTPSPVGPDTRVPTWRPSTTRALQSRRSNGGASAAGGSPTLCADGSYVTGSCTLAPNGSYVGGRAQLAPDGSYVSGTPRLAPNGSYVGGTGQVMMCADGSYVNGNRCRLMPNGQYIGE